MASSEAQISTKVVSSRVVNHRVRNIVLMCIIVVAWLVADQITKAHFDNFQVGENLGSPLPGIIQFTLVHNTGGAWGMLGDSTWLLAIASIVVCIVAIAYIAITPTLSLAADIGLSLIIAGGIGNLLDRLLNGYVIDFIEPAFIDFPVFNIADIGVTCGVVIFIAALLFEWMQGDDEAKGDAEDEGNSEDAAVVDGEA